MNRAKKGDGMGLENQSPGGNARKSGGSEGYVLSLSSGRPEGGWVHVSSDKFPHPFELRFGVTPGRRAVCIGACLCADADDAYPVGVSLLKRLPIREVTSMVQESAAADEEAAARMRMLLTDAPEVDVVGGGPGRAGYSTEMLRQVALEYVSAVNAGKRHPLLQVALMLDRSEAQARRVVQQALDRFPDIRPDEEDA
jgi:hypothetical protein